MTDQSPVSFPRTAAPLALPGVGVVLGQRGKEGTQRQDWSGSLHGAGSGLNLPLQDRCDSILLTSEGLGQSPGVLDTIFLPLRVDGGWRRIRECSFCQRVSSKCLTAF